MKKSTQEVSVAWAVWKFTPRPFENFRRQIVGSPTYRVECDMEHQADYIGALMQAREDRNLHWDVPLRARLELRDLELFEEEVSKLSTDDLNVQQLLGYARATRTLLEALVQETAKERT